MIDSIRAELLRLRRWPVLWSLLAVWLTLNLTFMYLLNYISYSSDSSSDATEGQPREYVLAQMMPAAVPEEFVGGTVLFGGALMLILGALATGSGYGWGTWKTVFTQGPARVTALLGTVLALLTVAGVAVVGAFALDLSVACVIASAESQPLRLPSVGRILAGVGSGIAILTMWTLLGALIGLLARGPSLAVGLGLVWVLVLENVLRFFGEMLGSAGTVTHYLPGSVAGSLAGELRTLQGEATPGVLDLLGWPHAVVALAVYPVFFLAVAVVVVRRRDLV
ncbi:ABC transporter permease subunit [Nocardia caishijiensis]|uniref:ABC-type transport system involved in multi-copper enzyme maturation permease subunit n=1 Tax=Nocardia caishijiensis TaxID=184756 RepID=A0ABQ6YPP0_9NOCA|nr:ABC transporter permease subunit [Nocardia caishijiensis]KAF0847740.1 ABC-type transport system involved in multi-copper enzyme maturation permease subunit [Nocardia caishijiensis]